MDPGLIITTTRDGVLLRREALALGFDDTAIRRCLATGEWHRVRHGAYCDAGMWQRLGARGRRLLHATAVMRASRVHVLASHTTAVDVYGTPIWEPPDLTHLTRTDQRAGRQEAGVAQHRGLVRADDVTRRHGWWVTSGTRTALDVTTILDTEHSLVVVNGLLHAGETSEELLQSRLTTMAHWPDTLHTDLVLRLADGRCETAGESRTFFLCWSQHLPLPQPQVLIKDSSGRIIARVDFAWPELGVFLEFDGLVKYRKPDRDEDPAEVVIREKRREELVCAVTGWRCVRVIWADLARPGLTADRIRAAFAGQPFAA